MSETNELKGVRATHPEYDEMLPEWKKCRDVIQGGTRKLREECGTYLPSYYEEGQEAYNKRVARTVLFNASYRTLIGYRGLLLRKSPVIVVPEAAKVYLDDITMSGCSMKMFIAETVEEVLQSGRVGVYVNYPDASDAETIADARARNLRPSMHLCEAEAVTNWRCQRINNEYVLSLVVIKEETEELQADGFTVSESEHYRVLDLIPAPGDVIQADVPDSGYIYRVRMMHYDSEKKQDVTDNTYYPRMKGKYMSRIPFNFISPDDTEVDPDAPPFVDLVDVNITHFEQMSAYLHGCFWSGIPQPWISGVELKDGETLRLGGTAWVFPTIGAKANMLEVGTAGFPALEKILKRLEDQMILIGSRALELQHPGGTESMSTATIHLSGEHSVLAAIGESIAAGITRSLKTFVSWTGSDDSEVIVSLSKQFFDEPLSPEARTSIVKSWQVGAISDKTKFNLLKQGGDYEAAADFETEQEEIKKSTPPPDTSTPPNLTP